MFEFVDLIIAFVLGALAATTLLAWLIQRWANNIKSLIEEALKEVEEPKEDDIKTRVDAGRVILLEVEVANNQFFCYNSKTNQFVCQGRDVKEIIENFKQRFPGLNAILHTGNEEALKTLRQQLKETRESSDSIGSSS